MVGIESGHEVPRIDGLEAWLVLERPGLGKWAGEEGAESGPRWREDCLRRCFSFLRVEGQQAVSGGGEGHNVVAESGGGADLGEVVILSTLYALAQRLFHRPRGHWNTAENDISNHAFIQRKQLDQTVKLFFISTLTEESMAIVIGCRTSKDVWDALSRAYSHNSKARELSLKDDLLSLKRGDQSVSDYTCQFKALFDQLTAIRRPVDESDKSHWFLRRLGPEFSNLTVAQMSQDPLPDSTNLFAKALSHELFQKSLANTNHSRNPSQVAFTSTYHVCGRGFKGNRSYGFSSHKARSVKWTAMHSIAQNVSIETTIVLVVQPMQQTLQKPLLPTVKSRMTLCEIGT
ncbi:uncharacterized protein LOC127258435 [Andrographis paniculata]|uniref:uncharacterized protein LOC127258435 n=1 Tax=Andrographis paniculata TaxID=175694 RepID=UPI0021E998FD|nr:uncharacterized protein LOC127258435 [Andrographis paniculata]